MRLNGRNWLARQMTKAGLKYTQKDNTITWVQNWETAQALLDQQLTTSDHCWGEALREGLVFAILRPNSDFTSESW